MKNYKKELLPYLVIVTIGAVAIVAIVSLFLLKGSLVGAPIYSYVDEVQYPCLDDDVANNYYVAGTLQYGKVLYEDYCMGDKLFQHQCTTSNTIDLLGPYTCPRGCDLGACLN